MFYLTKTPGLLKKLMPDCVWDKPSDRNVLYLTFDDGPHGGATPFVLEQLQRFQAKATFFCIGKNVEAEPELYKSILQQGHRVGNHTWNHVNGWKTPDKDYLNEILKTRDLVDSKLFRPPYGKISAFQVRTLINEMAYEVIMWDVLSGDFDLSIDGKKCARRVIGSARPGSIIVFHDSAKGLPRLEIALPEILAYFANQGYVFETL